MGIAVKKHECCKDFDFFVEACSNVKGTTFSYWIDSSGGYELSSEIKYCPWCGEKLEVDDV
jgi:hypothetical protein